MSDALAALAAAVAAAPSSAPLRVHYASLLLAAGRPVEALEQASTALRIDPADGEALRLVQDSAVAAATASRPATGTGAPGGEADPAGRPTPGGPATHPAGGPPAVPHGTSLHAPTSAPGGLDDGIITGVPSDVTVPRAPGARTPGDPATGVPAAPADPGSPTTPTAPSGIDWDRLEHEVGIHVPAPFVETSPGQGPTVPPAGPGTPPREDAATAPPAPGDRPFLVPARDDAPDDGSGLLEVSRETVTLADVGGLEPVKQRIREAFLEPMRNQAIAKAFGKSLRGGLLLYGPPGTGKTYMARAVAGELGARFLTVTLADILDKYIGESEQNLHALFQRARQLAPAVLFLDEVDAIGGKRAQYSGSSGMRTVVNQLLQEMDGIGSDNDGLFVLGATNHPWDVDTALLRPGRFDRVVLVLPPDEPAREAILRHHLAGRPVAGIDLRAIVARTDGFSGADLEHLAATAAEKAMMDSIATGQVRPITMADLHAALADVRPSTTAWLQSARNVVTFANNDGRYDDLAAYLRARRML
ncbi:ATP-binding protein [Cellulosimicrobium protaetiae]|uniref:AAA family ATPase n=1 Tax=Cellulosimicrobium protaetiae TaxID=2587808 RepID=A0A6M5UA02_9MICO|nr:ATP-binding protein [Cellulosimicrobium protaetiae]QJW35337.1 AAA family ATPase [Cellulosimicrobium protaetiae]